MDYLFLARFLVNPAKKIQKPSCLWITCVYIFEKMCAHRGSARQYWTFPARRQARLHRGKNPRNACSSRPAGGENRHHHVELAPAFT